jgi:hypothetical protein
VRTIAVFQFEVERAVGYSVLCHFHHLGGVLAEEGGLQYSSGMPLEELRARGTAAKPVPKAGRHTGAVLPSKDTSHNETYRELAAFFDLSVIEHNLKRPLPEVTK